MRIGFKSFLSAYFILLVASTPAAQAGLFGYSELGIIKKSENTFLFIAPDGETVDEASLRFAIGRTAKLLGFTHFIFEPVFDKPAAKSKSSKSDASAEAAPVVEEQKPVTRVMVYFYNSPRSRNGVKSIPLSDIDPDHIESAPVVEEAKPEPKKKKEEAAKQDLTPVAEPAPVVAVEKPAPKKKKEVAPQEVLPVVETAPAVVVETPAPKKKKKEAVPEEVVPVVEPAPAVVVEKPVRKQKKDIAPQKVIPVADVTSVVEAEKPVPPKSKPRPRRYLLPGDIEQTQEGKARMHDLGDLFN